MIDDEFSHRTAKLVLVITLLFIQGQVTTSYGDKKAVYQEQDFQEKLGFSEGEPLRREKRQSSNFSDGDNKTEEQKDFQEKLRFPQGEPLRQREKRRSWTGNRKERSLCSSKSLCSGNKTVFENDEIIGCYCDKACFETFHDCCPDYERTCGKQNATISTKERATLPSWWKCVNMGMRDCPAKISGVWMIQRCPSTWPSGETKRKCHNASNVFSYPVEDFLPVVAENQFTYRNKHCAICHGIQSYTDWDIVMKIESDDSPPSNYDINEKIRYIIDNGGKFLYVKLPTDQPRRYCAGEKYQSSCNNVFHIQYKDCLNGPVEVVGLTWWGFFKNKACASCNGYPNINDWPHESSSCGYLNVPGIFHTVFKIRNPNGPVSNLTVLI